MKQLVLVCCLFACFSNPLFSQIVTSVDFSGDRIVEPGLDNYVNVTVKNTQKLPIYNFKGEYQVCLIYRGPGNAGQAFNKQISLVDELDPGKSVVIKFLLTGPSLPGKYDVSILLKRGNKAASNIETVTFIVEEEYDASIDVKLSSFDIKLGSTRDIDILFTIKNTGRTAWPEGKYSLDFDAVSAPSQGSKVDKEAFEIDPKTFESWSFEPGEEDQYEYSNFLPPLTTGSYVVNITLLLDGKPFKAKGATTSVTFKFKVYR